MKVREKQLEAVTRLWDAHRQAEFPTRLRDEDPLGVSMVMLDADIAGCVSSWLHDQGSLDVGRRRVLNASVADLDRVLPLLIDQQERAYYGRLRAMAAAILGT